MLPLICASVSLFDRFFSQQELILRTKLEAESPGRLRETYYETEVAGNTIPLVGANMYMCVGIIADIWN